MKPTKRQLPSTTWIVIPGFNEEKYVRRVLKKVRQYTENIIFVDDGSKDATAQEAKKEIQHVLRHTINLGKGAALKTGCDYAFHHLNAQNVIVMDSDDQHNPEELATFSKHLRAGSMVVFGARAIDAQMPYLKRVLNKLASYSVALFFGGTFIPDIPSGYKAFTKAAYTKIRWDAQGYQVEMEIACRVAKYKLPFSSFTIDTIYLDHDKGMNILHILDIFHSILWWRITL